MFMARNFIVDWKFVHTKSANNDLRMTIIRVIFFCTLIRSGGPSTFLGNVLF